MKISILSLSITILMAAGCTSGKKDQPTTNINKKSSMENISNNSEESQKSKELYPKLSNYIESVIKEIDTIPEDRKQELKKVALFVQSKRLSDEPANLVFICTHNSRRSQMSQIWAATAAAYYKMEEDINTYSGGTETTAFNQRAVAAIQRAGFKVENPGGFNPHYMVSYADKAQKMECFSKKYNDPYNDAKNFVALMTCSKADESCPYIPGASLRVTIPYIDPKEADYSQQETAAYDARCRQIAREMLYIMSQAKG